MGLNIFYFAELFEFFGVSYSAESISPQYSILRGVTRDSSHFFMIGESVFSILKFEQHGDLITNDENLVGVSL